MNVAVVGLGKIGLPLAVQFARRGQDVVGVDVNQDVVDSVNRAIEPFPGEAHLQDYLTDVVGSGRLRATADYSDAIPTADVVVVVVPLFVGDDHAPDFDWMDSATRSIAMNLSSDTLVIYETTLPVGTTRTRWKPALELGSGLDEGSDFNLVFSPERVLTGRVFEDLRKYPKLAGGLSDEGARRAVSFYQTVLEFDERPDLVRGNGVWDLGSAEAAEMAKLAETTYRDVNIGLANQFARFAEGAGIDVYRVIEASNSQPYSHIHRPGIAVGGHCIPVYPRLYLSNDPHATVVRAAREANASMPEHAIRVLEANYGDLSGARVAVLGASYRSGVKETAFSGVFQIVEALNKRGARVSVHDPFYSRTELESLGFAQYVFGEPVDAAVLHTDHPEYQHLSPQDLPGISALIDGRAVIPADSFDNGQLITLGVGDRTIPLSAD